MFTKFAAHVANKIRRTIFLPVSTTFYTKKGPAVGTIWFDKEEKGRTTFGVHEVSKDTVYKYGSDAFRAEPLKTFIARVAIGRYVLVGIQPRQISHVESL